MRLHRMILNNVVKSLGPVPLSLCVIRTSLPNLSQLPKQPHSACYVHLLTSAHSEPRWVACSIPPALCSAVCLCRVHIYVKTPVSHAGIVDVCLIPEVPFRLDGDTGLLAYVDKVLSERGHCVLCVAEGAGQVCSHFGRLLEFTSEGIRSVPIVRPVRCAGHVQVTACPPHK